MALTGTLADVGFDELTSLLQQQSRTGVLTLELELGRVEIGFRDGMIVQVDDESRSSWERLGQLLVGGQCVDSASLEAALRSQRSSGKPLGTELVARGQLAVADLQRYLDLQFRESLYPLFTIKHGRFAFAPGEFRPRQLAPPPIAVEALTMDAVRQIDELPALREEIGGLDVRFRALSGGAAADVAGATLGDRQKAVLKAVPEAPTVRKLVARTGLGSFEVIRALVAVCQAGLAERVDPTGEADALTAERPRTTFFSRHPRLVTAAVQLVLTVGATAVALAALVTLLLWGRTAVGPGHSFDEVYSPVRQFRVERQLDRLEHAIEIYRLERGHYPDTLTALVEARLVDSSGLTYPDFGEPYYYRQTVDSFVLLPPKR